MILDAPAFGTARKHRMDSRFASRFEPNKAHTPIGPGGSAAGRVYQLLRQRIIDLDLPPDTTLSRNQLAKEYGVSQTPIRDAIQRLEHDGLVKIYPQSKTVVTRIDLPSIYEAHFLRSALEIEVARTLAASDAHPDLGKAHSILRMQEAIADDPGQIPVFQELDALFHEALVSAIGRGALFRFVQAHSGNLDRARRLHLAEKGKVQQVLRDHRHILDRIEAHDTEGAEQAMRSHLSQTVARIEDLRNTHPDYIA